MNRPLIAVLAFCLFVAGCGQDSTSYDVDISMTSIVWQGYANEDTVLLQKLNETEECLITLNASIKDGYPYVILVQDRFYCGGFSDISGCVVPEANTIYLKQTVFIFKHEVVHWATGFTNDMHDSLYFTQCEYPEANTIPGNL